MRSTLTQKLQLSFDAVFYYVTDMESSLAFYRDTLGLPLVSEKFVARFDLDGVLIELVPAPPGTVVPGNGNARLCFAVKDIEETVHLLHQRGIETSDIRDKKDGKLAFFRDPDGNELSLWEYCHPADARGIVKSAQI